MTAPDAGISVVPANQASWEDLQSVFGTRGQASRCQCQRYKLRPREYEESFPVEERAHRLRQQTDCGHPESDATSGLVAYVDGQPVGWCAVEPRSAYSRLVGSHRVAWSGRTEDRADDTVWAVTCVLTRAGFRRRGVSRALARAAVDFAHVGTRGTFAAAGFREVSRPTLRRVVMRLDF